jgi:hypothetical protein
MTARFVMVKRLSGAFRWWSIFESLVEMWALASTPYASGMYLTRSLQHFDRLTKFAARLSEYPFKQV